MGSMKLYVGNIPFKASEDDLRDLFAQAGEVVSVKLIRDKETGRMRGFGFVEMGSTEAGNKAIDMFNGKDFMQRSIVVNEAKPTAPRQGGFRPRESRSEG